MGCGTALVKYILFARNFNFVLCGIGLIVAGALTQTGYLKYVDFLDEPLGAYQAPPIMMIVIGSIVFLIAFAGCCGAIRENNCLMTTYAILMGVILVVEVAVVVVIVVYQDDFQKFLGDEMKKSMPKYYEVSDRGTEVKNTWDILQREYKCCGVDAPSDWGIVGLPKSCCDGQHESIPCTSLNAYQQGCLQKAIDVIGVKYIIIAGSIFAGALLIAIFFACCLAARFRRK